MKVKWFLICFICWPLASACMAQMGEKEFQQFYLNYYQHAAADEILPAFETFIKNVYPDTGNPVWRVEKDKLFLARFFALVAQTHPEVLRLGEQLFTQSRWEQKYTLLEVFKRVKDAQLESNLHQWALAEEDDDRRVLIEHATSESEASEKSLWYHPIRTLEQLDEQWACFFAQGNTRVVEASVELLNNTVLGYYQPEKEGEAAGNELYPRERRLREQAVQYLLARAPHHSALCLALLQNSRFIQSQSGASLLEDLAFQTLALQNAELSRALVEKLPASTDAKTKTFLTGALAALEGQEGTAESCRREIEKSDQVWSEWLRGYQALTEQTRASQEWKQSGFLVSGNSVAVLCSQMLTEAKNLGRYELWDLQEYPLRELPQAFYSQQIKISQKPDLRFETRIKVRPETAWIIRDADTLLWSKAKSNWVHIENKVVNDQIKTATGIEELRNILASQYPSAINRIIAPTAEYANLVYPRLENVDLLEDEIRQYFPDHTGSVIKGIQLWVDPKNGQIFRLEIELEIHKDAQIIADGKVIEVFYPYNAADISWAKGLP